MLCSLIQVLLTGQNRHSEYYYISEIELWDSTLVKEIASFIDFLEEGDKIWSTLKYLEIPEEISDSSKYGYFRLFVKRNKNIRTNIVGESDQFPAISYTLIWISQPEYFSKSATGFKLGTELPKYYTYVSNKMIFIYDSHNSYLPKKISMKKRHARYLDKLIERELPEPFITEFGDLGKVPIYPTIPLFSCNSMSVTHYFGTEENPNPEPKVVYCGEVIEHYNDPWK